MSFLVYKVMNSITIFKHSNQTLLLLKKLSSFEFFSEFEEESIKKYISVNDLYSQFDFLSPDIILMRFRPNCSRQS